MKLCYTWTTSTKICDDLLILKAWNISQVDCFVVHLITGWVKVGFFLNLTPPPQKPIGQPHPDPILNTPKPFFQVLLFSCKIIR